MSLGRLSFELAGCVSRNGFWVKGFAGIFGFESGFAGLGRAIRRRRKGLRWARRDVPRRRARPGIGAGNATALSLAPPSLGF